MNRFSEKIKIVYLLMVILFAAGVFVYLLDTWGVIRLEDTFTFLKKEPPTVAASHDSPTLLELEQLQKEKDRLKDLETELREKEAGLSREKSELQKKQEELQEVRKGLDIEKKKMAEDRALLMERERLIENMASRLVAMPPGDAVAIVAGWSNSDLVDVFRRMEQMAEDEGRQSIVPFLLTKLPRDRARIITSLMLDSEASRLPRTDIR